MRLWWMVVVVVVAGCDRFTATPARWQLVTTEFTFIENNVRTHEPRVFRIDTVTGAVDQLIEVDGPAATVTSWVTVGDGHPHTTKGAPGHPTRDDPFADISSDDAGLPAGIW